jgi:chromosome segregation ATPase
VLATLIADSEAAAVEAADFALQQERNIHMTTIAERDQLRAEIARIDSEKPWLKEANATNADLRAEVARLSEWQESVIKNARAHHAHLKDAIARAERAEASLHALRRICGTTDADKFSTWVDRANARAARAEAELAAAKLLLNEETDCAEAVEAAIVRQYARAERAEAELAAERARLDDLVSVNATGAARLAHATAQLAAEREKVRVLREALDEAQSCGGLTGSIFMQARAALAATEETP